MQWYHAVLLVVAATVAAPPPATGQLFEIPETYSGDLESRVRLTGDWGGVRNDLAKRGVILDVDLLQTVQGVWSGGRDTGHEYWGSADYTLNVDFGKLGLWPGGFLKIKGESSFGNSVNQKAGAIIPVNGDSLFPVPDDPDTTLTSVVFTQFLAQWFGVFLGKIDTLDGDANEFADDHRTKFLNPAFDFNFIGLRTVPYTGLGAGVILIPTDSVLFTALAIDTEGKANESGFDTVFDDGTTLSGELTVKIAPLGLPGHQRVGFMWSNKDFVSLEQDPRNLLFRLLVQRFPALGQAIPVEDIRREDGSWAVSYNFDQYLWAEQGEGGRVRRGVGVFFRFGVSDGEANPIKYFFSAGVGGKGVIPSRPLDTFGIGWYRLEFSDDLFPVLRGQFALGLEHEQGVELFYNAALTPWLFATASLQIVEQGLEKTLQPGPTLKDVDTAVVGGLRLYTRF
jgi:porin